MRGVIFGRCGAWIGGGLLAATFCLPAHADQPTHITQACRAGDTKILSPANIADLSSEQAAPLVLALMDVMAKGAALRENKSSQTWTVEETIMVAFADQAERERTGAAAGTILTSDLGPMIRWQDPYVGTICMLPVPLGTQLDTQAALPVLGADDIIWRADPSTAAGKVLSQIIMISDRPL